MAPRGGATSSRGRGKFKVSRGGGRHFSRDIAVVDHGMESLGLGEGDEDDDDEEEDSEEEDSDEEGNTRSGAPAVEMTRAERKAMKKAQSGKASGGKTEVIKPIGESSDEEGSSDEDSEAPAAAKSSATAASKPAAASGSRAAGGQKDDPLFSREQVGPSRKEREAADKKAAAERYARLHAAGKTDEAKSDMARLAEIRRKREADKARREAEDAEAQRAKDARANQRTAPTSRSRK